MPRTFALRRRWTSLAWAVALALGLASLVAGPAAAVPAFAAQTGMNCNACHVGGFGPQLTPFGRQFKAGGYTLRTNPFNVPLSAMAVTSYVHTQKDQPSPPAPDFNSNDNAAVDQVSLFIAGGWGQHFGAFVQTTYDGIAKAFTWDNLDLRGATTTSVHGHNVVAGVSVNNSPTVSDPFNTLNAWGFPYTGSALAPSPAASPMIGNLAQGVLGTTAYAWVDGKVYVEGGAYASPNSKLLTRLGADPTSPGTLRNAAPYLRAAYVQDFGTSNLQGGVFGFWADLNPGDDRTTGTSDHYADVGVDASWQLFKENKDAFTVNARYTHENQKLNASQALGLAQFRDNTLNDYRIDASYYWRNKIGFTVSGFDTTGSADPLLYAANRTFKPDSSGVTFQVDATPWGASDSPLGKRFNTRLGLQYTAYGRFDGASRNFDGLGHDASDNNTLRLFAWFAY
jgi:hypothetical protein